MDYVPEETGGFNPLERGIGEKPLQQACFFLPDFQRDLTVGSIRRRCV